jgi:universal stress protein A
MTMSASIDPNLKTDKKRPVLVAVDFSEDSKAALVWACRNCSHSEAPLVLLHVVHDPASTPGFYRSGDEDYLLPMQSVAESMMINFLDQVKSEDPTLNGLLATAETHCIPGLPPTRIVEFAQLLNCSLIVIGCRGNTGLEHMLLGSVAERVVELAPCPVVVVKPDKAQSSDG